MSEIKASLNANIEEALRIDSSIFSGNNVGQHSSRETLPTTSDEEAIDNLTKSSPQHLEEESLKRKRFSRFRKVVSGMKSSRNKKVEHVFLDNNAVVIRDQMKIGDAKNMSKQNKTNQGSSISRMWYALFPNKESPDVIRNGTPVEAVTIRERSSKTLGRFFGLKQFKGNTIETELDYSQKSSTLGGSRWSKGFSFKNIRTSKAHEDNNIAPI